MFNRRTFRVHQIEYDKEEYGCQGVGAFIQPTLPCDIQNEKLFRQAKCASIFDVYPIKTPLAVLRASGLIHEVHPPDGAVPEYRGIRSVGTSMDTIKGESLIIQ